MLTTLFVLLRSIGLICGGHRAVALENLALRQQLAALTRTIKRPELRSAESDRRSEALPVVAELPRRRRAMSVLHAIRKIARHRSTVPVELGHWMGSVAIACTRCISLF